MELNKMAEHIRSAAIKVNTVFFIGKNHGQCLKKLKSGCEQGFMAADGLGREWRFVNRKEALEIAIKAGQSIDKHNPMEELLSEDLANDKRFIG